MNGKLFLSKIIILVIKLETINIWEKVGKIYMLEKWNNYNLNMFLKKSRFKYFNNINFLFKYRSKFYFINLCKYVIM